MCKKNELMLVKKNIISEMCLEKCHKHMEFIQGAFNKFPDYFVQAFKIVVDS